MKTTDITIVTSNVEYALQLVNSKKHGQCLLMEGDAIELLAAQNNIQRSKEKKVLELLDDILLDSPSGVPVAPIEAMLENKFVTKRVPNAIDKALEAADAEAAADEEEETPEPPRRGRRASKAEALPPIRRGRAASKDPVLAHAQSLMAELKSFIDNYAAV